MAAPASAVKVTAAEWRASVLALLELGRGQEALEMLQRAVAEVSGERQFEELLGLLDGFPDAFRRTEAVTRLRLRLLGNLPGFKDRVPQEVQRAWDAGMAAPFLHVFMAWVLSEQEDDPASLRHSSQVLGELEGLLPFERVLFWRTRGCSLARTGHVGWDAAFRSALREAVGRSRVMILLDWAAFRSRRSDLAGAMECLGEALILAKRDPLEVRVAEHLGLLCWRMGEFQDAERHFRRMEQLSLKPGARGLRSRALCSLALTRRALGEWKRAEQLYDEALAVAVKLGDEDDQRQALWGLGLTRRLAGRPVSALEPLEQAARMVRGDRESGQSWVYVDIAAALVSMQHFDAPAVQSALGRSGRLGGENLALAGLVGAELARRTGDTAGALAQLQDIPLESVRMREEAHAFPELFALLAADARPNPLPRSVQTVVSFRALGFPQVLVNGREISVPLLGVVVLAALLDGEGQASKDTLTEVLRDGQPRTPRLAEQRVSKAVSTLRRALGWDTSVVTRPGHYTLDADAIWQYDVTEALAAGLPIQAFLRGIDLPWVTDREQALSLRD